MFTFFKSKRSVTKTIEAIHNEFDTAGERLLAEAKNILSGRAITDKGERLKALGFTNAKDAAKNDAIVLQNRKIEEENQKRKAAAHWVQYYSQWYPHHKFITKEIVVEICNKYNLYCCSVGQYKADGPLKNIIEMEQFKLREDDMQIRTALNSQRYHIKEEFKICAPEKDFDMSGMSKSGRFIIPDPIVLQPVNGGYLIVTKWGLEAYDELVINDKKN